MTLIAKNRIIWGAKEFKAGETFEVPKDIAKQFIALGWAEAPKKEKKTK